MDHVVPLVRGGFTVRSNVVPCCGECNTNKKDLIPFEWEAYLAGLQVGWYSNLEEISALWRCERTFEPQMTEAERERLYSGWLDAISRVKCRDQTGAEA